MGFVDDLDEHVGNELKHQYRIAEFFCQMNYFPIGSFDQLLILSLVYKGCLKYIEASCIESFVLYFIG